MMMRLLTSKSSPLLVLLLLRLVGAWNELEDGTPELAGEHVEHHDQYNVASVRKPRGRGVSIGGRVYSVVEVQEPLEEELERRRLGLDRELHGRWSSWSSQNVFLGDRSRGRGRGGKGKGKGGARGGGRRNNYYDISTTSYYGRNPYRRRSSSKGSSKSRRRRSGRRPTRPSYYGVIATTTSSGNSGGSLFSGLFGGGGGGGGGGTMKRPDMIRPLMMTPFPTPFPTPLPTPQPTMLPTTRTPTTPVPTSQPPTAAGLTTNTTTVAPATTSSFRFLTELGLTYFSGQPTDVDRDLTEAEWVELQSVIGEFYTDIFTADLTFSSQFRSFAPTFFGNTTTTLLLFTNNANSTTTTTNATATPITLTNGKLYTAGAVFPPGIPPSLAIPFDSNFEFAAGSTTITNNQLLQKMINVDYATFITNYLRRQPPSNQLDLVQQVQFEGQT